MIPTSIASNSSFDKEETDVADKEEIVPATASLETNDVNESPVTFMRDFLLRK